MRFHSIALLGCLIAASLAVPLLDIDITSDAKSIKNTCTNLKLAEDGHTLTATCQSCDCSSKSSKESSIDLDKFVGNDDGHFQWGGIDYTKSSTSLKLTDTILQGVLQDIGGNPMKATLDLAERIKNVDGTLTYMRETPTS